MAISYVTNALGATNSTTSFSITLPATQAGDILILEYVHRGSGDATLGGTSITTDGLTWTEKHDQQFNTTPFSAKTVWTRATGDHSGKTITGSGLTNSCAAIVTVYRGALASGDPLADATIVGEDNASGNETQAEITTASDGAWVVLVVANSPDFAISSQASTNVTLTERAERLSTGGTDSSIAHASGEMATAGATGSFTWAQTNGVSGSWAYAITPANTPPTVALTTNATTIFNDTFTDTTGVTLQSHTPNTGTSWTRVWSSNASYGWEIDTNQVIANGSLSEGAIYSADVTYPTANYAAQLTIVAVGDTDDPLYLIVRMQDQENMYAVRLVDGANGSQLYKKVSGTWTALGSTFTRPVNGSVVKLEIIGSILNFYDDGVLLASVSDTAITGIGKAGVAGGGATELVNSGDDLSNQAFDNFSVIAYPEISDTTPDFTFTGTDPNGDDVRYKVEIRPISLTDLLGFIDDFDDNSINTHLWNSWGAEQVVEQNNQLEVSSTTAASYFGTESNTTYNLTGKQCLVELVSAGNQTISQFDAIPIQLYADANNKLEWAINNGTIKARKIVATTLTDVATDTYNSSTHKWLRIRESGGTTYWDYSSNGTSWTNFASNANPITITALKYSAIVGNQSAASAGTTMIIDNLNVEPPTVEVVSGTDSGFSGSPDNTDPFASAQAVTYTVQSALSDGTYTVTVFGLDPSGSNTYGAGSNVISFTLVAGTTTTTQTIQGLARITKTVTQTILGRARITATTTQTILGRARIGIVSSQTILGLARITKSTTQTIQGLARITATSTQTILGRARITISTSQTIQGLASIVNTTSETIQGLARITAATTQTILGKAAILKTVFQTIQGLARITISTTQTILGRARITILTTQTLQGLARITASATQTILGRARITASASQTIQGISRITTSATQTIQGLARVTKTVTQTITGLARITVTSTQTILGRAKITNIASQTITGIANILVTASATQTILGLARITATTTQTILGRARITVTVTQTITGLARLTNTVSQTILGRARITASQVQTITGLSRITATSTQTILGLTRITKSVTQTITGISRITISTSQTILGRARVTKLTSQTLDGLARITASATQTIEGLARITTTGSQTILGKAAIVASGLTTATQTILGRARITTSSTQTITGKASIASNILPPQPRLVYSQGHWFLRLSDRLYKRL
jgi:hypothetical protein